MRRKCYGGRVSAFEVLSLAFKLLVSVWYSDEEYRKCYDVYKCITSVIFLVCNCVINVIILA